MKNKKDFRFHHHILNGNTVEFFRLRNKRRKGRT